MNEGTTLNEPNLTTTPAVTSDTSGGAAATETPAEKIVSWKDHQAALSDLHKFKQKALKLEQDQKSARENELKAKEQWKTLAEQREAEVNDWKNKYEGTVKSTVNLTKMSALKDECMKLGLSDEKDLEFLDLEDLQIETTNTGKMSVLGAKTFAERLKAIKPHWFRPTATVVNSSNPRIVDPSGPVSAQDVYAAEKAWRNSKKPEDLQNYQEVHAKYLKSRKGSAR